MVKRLVAIALIVFGASIAWFVLGATLVDRTQRSDDAQRYAVAGLWGTEQTQLPPSFSLSRSETSVTAKGKASVVQSTVTLDPRRTRAFVDLRLTQRRKGLLWYSTYAVDFAARYRVRNPGRAGMLAIAFEFPALEATYDDVVVRVDGRTLGTQTTRSGLTGSVTLARGADADVEVRYRSHGLGRWTYSFANGVASVHDFVLQLTTNFADIDFPPQTLAPTAEQRAGAGWRLVWNYHDLVAGYGIGMLCPERLQPGPLAQRLTFWAPVSLVFYVFVMLVITTLRRIDLHPINYFFLAAAFFAFHLLFAYLVDRISIELAFVICSAVSLALTISYLRLVVGLRFAALAGGLAQMFYQILFSLALFNEGTSGLSITIGAIVTLFVMMQLTGRIRWTQRLAEAKTA